MVEKCIAGVDISELKKLGAVSGFYATRDTGKMIIEPIPNILFQRDPMATVGNGATLHKMWATTRTRESIFAEYVFEYHPFYEKTKLYYDRKEPYCIEGGDIQVPEILDRTFKAESFQDFGFRLLLGIRDTLARCHQATHAREFQMGQQAHVRRPGFGEIYQRPQGDRNVGTFTRYREAVIAAEFDNRIL